MARRRAEHEANVKNESGVKSELSLKRERDPFTNGEVVELD